MSEYAAFNRGNMIYRYLGNTGLRVSVLSLGGWITYGGQVGDEIAVRCMEEAYKHGINFFDTAENYASGKSEISMGKAIKTLKLKRSEFVISTKLFWGTSPRGLNNIGLTRKKILESMDASLERLDLPYVDVVLAHRPDPLTPMEETVRAFTHIINSGKAFYWGTSEWSAFEIEHAQHIATKHNLIAPIADQPEYNLFKREKVEKELAPLYKLYSYGLTTFSPLKTGLLSGKYNDGIPEDGRYALKTNPDVARARERLQTPEGKAEIEKVRELSKLAEDLGATVAALSLAWAVKNENVSSVITGASKPEQIANNVKALELLPKLTPDVIQKIEDIFKNKPAPYNYEGRDL